MAKRQQAKHRDLYDQRCRGAELEIGDLVLVKQTAWKGRHKIQDKWETEEYQVVGQPTPGVPMYTVKRVAGGRTRVLHRNLLLPLQGRIRQEDGMRGEGISDSEDEEEGGEEMPKVARTQCGRPRGTTKPKASPSQQREASSKDASADLSGQKPHSLLASPSSPHHISGMRIAVRMNCTQTPLHHILQLVVQPHNHQHWKTIVQYNLLMLAYTESQFTPEMPYLESTQSDQITDSVFIE